MGENPKAQKEEKAAGDQKGNPEVFPKGANPSGVLILIIGLILAVIIIVLGFAFWDRFESEGRSDDRQSQGFNLPDVREATPSGEESGKSDLESQSKEETNQDDLIVDQTIEGIDETLTDTDSILNELDSIDQTQDNLPTL